MASLPTFPQVEGTGWSALRQWFASGPKPARAAFRASHPARVPNGFRGPLTITNQRIWIEGLPDSFRDFRILQLSDIHHSLFVPLDQVAAIVELSNSMKPDLIALTGDFVTYSRASIERVAEILGCLRARLGVVAVLGNHDFRVDAQAVQCALQRRHIEVLRNRHVLIRQGRETLPIAGVDDHGYGADLGKALAGVGLVHLIMLGAFM